MKKKKAGGEGQEQRVWTKPMIFLVGSMIPAILVMAVLLIILTSIKNDMPVQYAAPDGHLSQSIFSAQNTYYTPDDRFPNTFTFRTVPYTLDIPDGDIAVVNSSSLVKTGDHVVLYLAESEPDQMQDTMKKEIPLAFFPTTNLDEVTLTLVQSQRGYMNGYECTYLYAVVYGDKNSTTHAIGYLMTDSGSGKQFLICFLTDAGSNSNLETLQSYAETEMHLLVHTGSNPNEKETE